MNFHCPAGRAAGIALTSVLLAAAASATQTDLETRAFAALSLNNGEISNVTFDGAPGTATAVSLEFEGQLLTLDLAPHSAMNANSVVLEDRGNGELVEVDRGLVRTYRGSVRQMPGSVVAGGWMPDGFYGRIKQADGSDLWVQPLIKLIDGSSPSQHIVYRNSDIMESSASCGGALFAGAATDFSAAGQGNNNLGAGVSIADLGCDADFEFFQDHGSTTPLVTARVNLVIDTMNLQYESEVAITHVISTLIVRTTSNDPYSSTDANGLLDQFQDEWNNNQGGVVRDIAHLFTGKSIQGGTIGIAYLGVICNGSFGYGLVESDFNNNFGCATDLSAHELGHNWNAGHCTCTSNTMNPFITCANTFNASLSRPSIASHRDSRTCLDTGSLPPTANFAATPTSGFAPLNVNFTDTSNNSPSAWLWSFGDGSTSGVQNPSYLYTTPGTYDVSLLVSNANGSDALTKFGYIVVDGPTAGVCSSRNGSGANPDIFDCSNTPSIGNTWTSTVDAGSIGFGGLSFVFAYAAPSPFPLPTIYGEFLLDPGSGSLLFQTSFVLGGTVTHNVPLANDNSLIGVQVYTQVFLNQGALTNAIDLTIGS